MAIFLTILIATMLLLLYVKIEGRVSRRPCPGCGFTVSKDGLDEVCPKCGALIRQL